MCSLVALNACTSPDAVKDPNTNTAPEKVVVTPNDVGLALDSTAKLTAVAYDSSGNAMTGAVAPTWSSDDQSVATVDNAGSVRAVGVGTTKIEATIDNVVGTATVTVVLPAPVLTRVAITPASASIAVNDTVRLKATAYSQFNGVMNGLTATWKSSDTTVATVASNGLVTAKSSGTATITGTISGVAGTASITVTPPVVTLQRVDVTPDTAQVKVGGTATFTATAYGSDGRVFAGAPAATWSTGDTTIATVSGTGVVTGKAAGATTVTATINGVKGTATISVSAANTSSGALYPMVRESLKRLGNGGIDTLTDITVVGDHEQTGDKELEGLIDYDLSSIPTGSTVQKAVLNVGEDKQQSYGSPWTLGTLFVEGATSFSLDEGSVSTTAVPVATAEFTSAQVDITNIVKQAIANHQSTVILRFRYAQLGNNNGNIDYVWLNAAQIDLTLTK
ncbi:MAG TPA: Ig-like domain-containing protein [Gemmatimonadaceae bacterium]|nr:Ig-like domain-containing protein [Gemmatimonadaceae bacterium]